MPRVSKSLSKQLRELRLWHWRKLKESRRLERVWELRGNFHNSQEFKKAGDFHIKQVQLLNEFFKIGDTAENDFEQLCKSTKEN